MKSERPPTRVFRRLQTWVQRTERTEEGGGVHKFKSRVTNQIGSAARRSAAPKRKRRRRRRRRRNGRRRLWTADIVTKRADDRCVAPMFQCHHDAEARLVSRRRLLRGDRRPRFASVVPAIVLCVSPNRTSGWPVLFTGFRLISCRPLFSAVHRVWNLHFFPTTQWFLWAVESVLPAFTQFLPLCLYALDGISLLFNIQRHSTALTGFY